MLGDALRVFDLKVGTTPAARVVKPDGSTVSFVVLTPEQSRHFWRLPFGGRARAILSQATVFADGADLRLQASDVHALSLSVFPAVSGAKLAGSADGIFTHFAAPSPHPLPTPVVSVTRLQAAGPEAMRLKGTEESAWADAAVYTLNIPPTTANRHVLLNVHYIGDAARLYISDKLLDDNFFNGDPFPVALWRIPPSEWPDIRLKVLPFSPGLVNRLPEQARATVNEAQTVSTLDKISITCDEQTEWRLNAVSAR